MLDNLINFSHCILNLNNNEKYEDIKLFSFGFTRRNINFQIGSNTMEEKGQYRDNWIRFSIEMVDCIWFGRIFTETTPLCVCVKKPPEMCVRRSRIPNKIYSFCAYISSASN
jgi:hypothetical protein